MPHSATITTAFLERILAFLAPLFLIPGKSDIVAAGQAAAATLASYGARTSGN